MKSERRWRPAAAAIVLGSVLLAAAAPGPAWAVPQQVAVTAASVVALPVTPVVSAGPTVHGVLVQATPTSATVSWPSTGAAVTYVADRPQPEGGTTPAGAAGLSPAASGNLMAWTDSNTELTPDTVYTFTVTETDRTSGVARWADQVSVRTPSTSISGSLVTATPTESTLDLSWPPVAAATTYRIYRGDFVVAVTTATHLRDFGLTPSSQYAYRVDAIDTRVAPVQVLSTLAFTASTFRGPRPVEVAGLTAQTPTATKVRLAWSPIDWVSQYDILRDGARVASVDVPAFDDTTLADTDYTYRVVAHLPDGGTLASSAPLRVRTPMAGTAPTITAVTVTGTAAVGRPLTAHVATSEPAVRVSYQWLADGRPVPFATQVTHTPDASEYAAKLSVRVTVTWVDGPAATLTSSSLTVGPGSRSAGRPVVVGTWRVGQIVRMRFPDEATGVVHRRYQWLRNGTAIPGAVTSSYRLTASDYGRNVALRVSESVRGYLPATATSAAATVAWGGVLRATSATHIIGVVKAGHRVRAAVPAYTSAPTKYAYQWRLSGRTVSRSPSYLLPRNANGRTLRLYVRAAAPAYSASSWSSATCSRVGRCRSYIPSALPSDVAVAAAVTKWVNYYHRAATGGSSLPSDPYLTSLSQAHAVAMRARGYVFHTTSVGGQNVAATYQSSNDRTADAIGRTMVVAWMNSSGHKAQIVRPDAVSWGVGVAHTSAGAYFCALDVWTR